MGWFQAPRLTPQRIRLAYGVAVVADVMQLMLGPVGWAFGDQIIDIVAGIATWRILGFHPLLLPTFALEFIPVADMLPSWTACVALVIAHRKKQQMISPSPADGSTIDVEAKRVE